MLTSLMEKCVISIDCWAEFMAWFDCIRFVRIQMEFFKYTFIILSLTSNCSIQSQVSTYSKTFDRVI